MKVLFATKNKAKYEKYKSSLEDAGVEILNLHDVGVDLDVDETGITPAENAIIKAEAYSKHTGCVTIAVDDGLLFDNIPDNLQPNTHVRRINGNERATDEQLLEYYSSIVTSYGNNGILNGKWIKSIAVATGDETFHYDFESPKIFTNKIHEKKHEGYPLDSLSIDPEFNKYTIEITEKEYKNSKNKTNDNIINFIKLSLHI